MATAHPQSISLPPRPTFTSFGSSSSLLSSSTSASSSYPNGPSSSASTSERVHSGHTPKGSILLSPRPGGPSTLPNISQPVGATCPPPVPPTPSKITFAPLPPVAPEHELRRRNSITLGVAARSQLLKSQGVHGKKKNPDGVHYVSMTDEEWEAYKLRFSQQQGTVHEVPDLGTLAYRGGKKLFSKIRSLSSTSSTSASTSSSNNAASSPSPSPSPPPSINLPQQPDPLLLHLQNQHQHVRPGMGSPQLSHTPRSGSPPPPPFPRSSTAPHIVHLNPPQPPALVRSGSDTASSSSPPDSSYSGSIAEEEEEDEDEDDPELSAAEARLRARIAAGGSGSGEATPRRRSSFTGLSGMSGLEGGGGHDPFVLGFEKLSTGHLEDVESWRRERTASTTEREREMTTTTAGTGVVDLTDDGARR